MTSRARASYEEAERQFVENLRARYEGEGYIFTPYPGADKLPGFLGCYVPDAIAQKPGQNIAIEVRQRQGLSAESALKDIRKLFEGHPDWQFRVVFMGAELPHSVEVSVANPATIQGGINEARALLAQGHRRPAFIMAWSLLEAALRARNDEAGNRPYSPGTVVQTLAMNGYIEPDTERSMRALINVRNRIVHGDLDAEPTTADVDLVLSAVEEALSAEAA